jgi:opacity protein-like surface antigen
MKKLTALAALVAGMAISAMAADWSGYIVDQNCASKKEMLGNVQCAQSCMKRGSPAVLVTDDGKIYKIAQQDKVKDAAGKKVTLTGTMKGDDTISVDSVKEM